MIVSNFPGGSDVFALPLDGSKEMTGALKLGGNQIKNIGAPEEETDAARKQELTDHNKSEDAHANILGDIVKVTGGATMTMGETIGVGPYDIQITEDEGSEDISAKDVSYDNGSSGMTAIDVQGAINELMSTKTTEQYVNEKTKGFIPNTRTINGKPLTEDVSISASDVDAVPTTRTINGKPLTRDVSLAASDVDAVPTTRTINGKNLGANITLTAENVNAVPTSRTINGKPLTSNIALSSTDVGAAPSTHNHNASDITSGIFSIERGGTGVNSMTGTDYTTYRPRGITLQASVPASIPNGCIVGVYE